MTLPPWHAHLDVWLVLGSVVAAYLIAVRRRPRRRPSPARAHPAPPGARLFLAGDGGALARGGLADPRPRRAVPVQRAHGPAHAVHAGRRAAADRRHAGVAAPAAARGPAVAAACRASSPGRSSRWCSSTASCSSRTGRRSWSSRSRSELVALRAARAAGSARRSSCGGR